MSKTEKYLKVIATCAVIQTVIMGFTFLCDLLSDGEEDYFLDEDEDNVIYFGDD